MTKLAGNNALRACAGFATTIFSLGILRDYLYVHAIELQPILPLLESNVFKAVAVLLFLSGNVLVLSSMWALGVTGTYLGKYSRNTKISSHTNSSNQQEIILVF